MDYQTLKKKFSDTATLTATVGAARSVRVGIPSVDEFLSQIHLRNSFSEWGAPQGAMGRLLPALIIKSLASNCLWVADNEDVEFYPLFWSDLGVELDHIYLLREPDLLKNLRLPLREAKFNTVVLDTQGPVSAANLNYLSKLTRANNFTCMLIRRYYLGPNNGNPFCKYRLNSSYHIQSNQLRLNLIKGAGKRSAVVDLGEIFRG